VLTAIALAFFTAAFNLAAAGAWISWQATRSVERTSAGGRGGPLIRSGVTSNSPGEDRLRMHAPLGQRLPPRQLCPLDTARVSSPFGRRKDPLGRGWAFHSGIDLPGRLGAPVRAAAAGVITQAEYRPGYGNVVRIDHGGGTVTLYGHNQKLLVHRGEHVAASQQIALLGSTGRSTGPHLHFEIQLDGQRVDPQPYLHQTPPRMLDHWFGAVVGTPLCAAGWQSPHSTVSR
jgi:murein DD-endopeptidase MepM/ murein hydrolase activator NlpD